MKGIVTGDPEDRYTQDDVIEYLDSVNALLTDAEKKGCRDETERSLILNDIYYLGLFVLDIDKMYSENVDGTVVFHPWLFNRCRDVQDDPDFHVDIWAREHFKSTIITLLKTVQDILADPEIAICIYSYNKTIARKFVNQVKNALENQKLKRLFPDIIPDNPDSGKYSYTNEDGAVVTHKFSWSTEELTVKRKTRRKEPTLSGYGLVTGQPTGMHFDLLIYADVVTPDAVRTSEQNRYTTEQFRMSLNTGSGENVRVRIIGTRYSSYDTYFHILNPRYEKEGIMGGSRYSLRCHPCRTNEGVPVLYTDGYLKEKRNIMVSFVYDSQMMCDPQFSSDIGFKDEWIAERCSMDEIYADREKYNFYIIVDPANTKSNKSDFTAMVVVALNGDGRYYIPEIVRDKLLLTERINVLLGLVVKWSNSRSKPVVFYEQAGLSSDTQILSKVMEEKRFWLELHSMGTKPRVNLDPRAGTGAGSMKANRIFALEPLFRSHRIVLAESCTRTNWNGREEDMMASFIMDEYMKYPTSADHDDVLDALSRIADAETGPMLIPPVFRASLPKKLAAKKRIEEFDIYSGSEYIPF